MTSEMVAESQTTLVLPVEVKEPIFNFVGDTVQREPDSSPVDDVHSKLLTDLLEGEVKFVEDYEKHLRASVIGGKSNVSGSEILNRFTVKEVNGETIAVLPSSWCVPGGVMAPLLGLLQLRKIRLVPGRYDVPIRVDPKVAGLISNFLRGLEWEWTQQSRYPSLAGLQKMEFGAKVRLAVIYRRLQLCLQDSEHTAAILVKNHALFGNDPSSKSGNTILTDVATSLTVQLKDRAILKDILNFVIRQFKIHLDLPDAISKVAVPFSELVRSYYRTSRPKGRPSTKKGPKKELETLAAPKKPNDLVGFTKFENDIVKSMANRLWKEDRLVHQSNYHATLCKLPFPCVRELVSAVYKRRWEFIAKVQSLSSSRMKYIKNVLQKGHSDKANLQPADLFTFYSAEYERLPGIIYSELSQQFDEFDLKSSLNGLVGDETLETFENHYRVSLVAQYKKLDPDTKFNLKQLKSLQRTPLERYQTYYVMEKHIMELAYKLAQLRADSKRLERKITMRTRFQSQEYVGSMLFLLDALRSLKAFADDNEDRREILNLPRAEPVYGMSPENTFSQIRHFLHPRNVDNTICVLSLSFTPPTWSVYQLLEDGCSALTLDRIPVEASELYAVFSKTQGERHW